jgi:homocysteine S-methyltransferase
MVRRHELYKRGRLFAIGFNCCDPGQVLTAVEEVRKVCRDLPIVVYPNSGETWDGERHCWGGERTELTVDQIAGWLGMGVVGVGGCCRVDAAMVAKLKSCLVQCYQK